MVGIIITGHGEFASGLTNALKLLTGDQDNIIGVNFKPQESESDLQMHLLCSMIKRIYEFYTASIWVWQ